MKNFSILLLIVFSLNTITTLEAQNVASRNLKGTTVHDKFVDSISKLNYPYRFPILGEKLWKMGYDLPLPNGLMVNYTYGVQNITISNLKVGEDPNNLIDVSNLAYFESLEATVNVVTARYDVWLLPFLDVSILGGYVDSNTAVKLALPFDAQFNASSKGPVLGWGIVAAGGIGPVFGTVDYNMQWTFIPALDKPSKSSVFDVRVGHTFTFNKKQDMNVSLLVGAQYLKLNSASSGTANLGKLFGIPPGAREEAAQQLEDWYNGLSSHEQEIFGGIYNKIDGWLNKDDPGILHYSFNKKLYYPWAMTVGTNWQINKRWMTEVFYTFLGSREQLTLGLNYRFGIKGKNMLKGVTF